MGHIHNITESPSTNDVTKTNETTFTQSSYKSNTTLRTDPLPNMNNSFTPDQVSYIKHKLNDIVPYIHNAIQNNNNNSNSNNNNLILLQKHHEDSLEEDEDENITENITNIESDHSDHS